MYVSRDTAYTNLITYFNKGLHTFRVQTSRSLGLTPWVECDWRSIAPFLRDPTEKNENFIVNSQNKYCRSSSFRYQRCAAFDTRFTKKLFFVMQIWEKNITLKKFFKLNFVYKLFCFILYE
jgi:hypothetical protein